MNSGVRIIKGRVNNRPERSVQVDGLKTHQQTTREMVETVRNWITETKQRRRDEERKLAVLIK